MKAITLTQPWATLVAIGAKKLETRSWATRHTGPLAIHAAKGFPRYAIELCWEEPFRGALINAGYHTPGELPRGSVIAVVNLRGCIPTCVGLGLPEEPEMSFGDYGLGRYVWELADVRQMSPAPCKGSLGLWDWNTPFNESTYK